MFVDSHCHLDFPELSGRLPEVLQAMAEKRVTHALCVATTLEGCRRVRALAVGNANLYATAGVHPDEASAQEPSVDQLCELATRDKVVAVGETGLDYYRLTGDLEWQRERFRRHIRAARACGRPLVIHTRASAEDTLRLMREEGAGEAGGVMHCFTETLDTARQALDLGFLISFSGIVTFKSATELKAVAQAVPLERMLIETDAPYLAPVPHRGRINEPSYVPHVAEEIARLRDCSLEEVARATSDNFFELFRIPQP